MFNGSFTTCENPGTAMLVNNEYLTVVMTTESPNATNPKATAISKIEIAYRDGCYDQSYVITNTSFPTTAKNPGKGKNLVQISGNNIFFHGIKTRIQVRTVNGYLNFGISTPFTSGGICEKGCANRRVLDTSRIL